MKAQCLVEEREGRELDSFDLITVLGWLKEHAFKEIWRRYGPGGQQASKLNLALNLEGYYLEMTLESLAALALSPKYQASPHLVQVLVRRLLCGHQETLPKSTGEEKKVYLPNQAGDYTITVSLERKAVHHRHAPGGAAPIRRPLR